MKDLSYNFVKIDEVERDITDMSVFYNINFLKEMSKKVEVKFFLALYKTKIIAVIPIFYREVFKKKISVIPQLVYYQPISFILEKKKRKNENELLKIEVLLMFIEFMNSSFLSWNIKFDPSFIDVRPFIWENVKYKNFYTYVIDLQNINEDFYFRKQRTSIKKAKNNNFIVEENFDLSNFFRLQEKASKRTSHYINVKVKEQEKILTSLYENKIIKQFNVVSKGIVVSTWIMIEDKLQLIVYAWQHYSDPEFLSLGISPFLYDFLFNHYKKLEFKFLDLCGANNKNISRIKAAMGGNLKSFFYLSKSNSKIYDILKFIKK